MSKFTEHLGLGEKAILAEVCGVYPHLCSELFQFQLEGLAVLSLIFLDFFQLSLVLFGLLQGVVGG